MTDPLRRLMQTFRHGSFVALAGWIGVLPALAQAPDDPLRAYVSQQDPAYHWELLREGEVVGVPYTELLLTSQVWRGIPWRHQLYVLWPRNIAAGTSHALLFVHGGRWSEEWADPDHSPKLPREAPLFARLAEVLGTPLAILGQTPFQPLFDGLTEDRLVSYSFERYLKTGETDWPILLPMVKAAVRAMDVVEEHGRQFGDVSIETFTVTGASKRGWTTWLTAAVDERVRGIVPIVIDVLNMDEHLELQIDSWGDYSAQIADYVERGLHERMGTAEGQALLSIVDPYRYRDRLQLPKLIINGTNDEYWPLDALNLYWDALPGPKRILYLPNQGHDAGDYPRIIGTLAAFHGHLTHGDPLPAPGWRFEEDEAGLRLRVWSDRAPASVTAWTGESPTRDFRRSGWTPRDCKPGGEAFICELDRPGHGYAALFAELTYPVDREVPPLQLSTQVRIIGADDSR